MAFTFNDVKNLADLEKKLADLPPVQPGFKRLYRGQTRDYDGLMLPSFYRKGGLFDDLYYSWKLAGQRIVKEEILKINIDSPKENDASLNFPIDALMQHYGGHSGGLDVTDDIKVAMWFALFKHHQTTTQDSIMQTPLQKAALFEVKKAYYSKSDNEFSCLYVFDCELWVEGNNPKIGDCVDLQKWFGKYTSRPARQKGWYIYSDEVEEPKADLKRFVKAVFKIPKTIREQINNGADEETLYYFPTPDDDSFYKRILQSSFICSADNVFKKLIEITQYYNNAEDDNEAVNKSYTDTIRIQYYENYFETLKQRNASRNHYVNIENIKYRLSDALLIKMKVPDWYIIINERQSDEVVYAPVFEDIILPPNNYLFNFFIDFANSEMVVAEPQKGYARGAWVVRQHNFIWIQYYFSLGENIGDFDGAWFTDDGNGRPKLHDPNGKLSAVAKIDYQLSLTSALRVIQTYKKIIFLPRFIPFKKVYSDE